MRLKVVHVSYSDRLGGAGLAASRLHRGLLNRGIDSSMIVGKKLSSDPTVRRVTEQPLRELARRARVAIELAACKLANAQNQIGGFRPGFLGTPMHNHPLYRSANVINLHWINNALVDPKMVARFVASGKRVVWTMHDMWPLTGGCHYAGPCERFLDGCGACPLLQSSKTHDLSRRMYDLKRKYYPEGLVGVTPSKWLGEQARLSSLWRNNPMFVIPNGIDLDVFGHGDRNAARASFDLPRDRPVVLFGASTIDEPRKGYDLLVQAIKIIQSKKEGLEICFARFGALQSYGADSIPMKNMGVITCEKDLHKLYLSADVFVSPSTQDNLPNTMLESMASGTPVVAFNVGGYSDAVVHLRTGYLASPFQSEDLASGILKMIANARAGNEMRTNCIRHVADNFSIDHQAERYIQLYNSLLA